MSKILELAEILRTAATRSQQDEARAALAAEVEKLKAESDEMALIGVRTVADVLALDAEIESYRQQLRKEQLYVQALRAELEAVRKDAERYRWLRERDDWVLMPGMRNEGYMRSCLDDQIDLSMGAFLEATK